MVNTQKSLTYLWKRWPHVSFLAELIESQQIAQSSLFLISSSSVAKGNLTIEQNHWVLKCSWITSLIVYSWFSPMNVRHKPWQYYWNHEVMISLLIFWSVVQDKDGQREVLNFLDLLRPIPIPFSVMRAFFLLFCTTMLWIFSHIAFRTPSICQPFLLIYAGFHASYTPRFCPLQFPYALCLQVPQLLYIVHQHANLRTYM